MVEQTICAVTDCSNHVHARDYCHFHYRRYKRLGDPLAGGKRKIDKGTTLKWIEANSRHEGDECLIWPFGRRTDGYGAAHHEGKPCNASRVMCIVAHGKPSVPMEAAHSCGKGHLGCVNPRHLRWLTHKQNHEEKLIHGTNMPGERHPKATISDGQAREIMSLKGKMRQRDLAAQLGVGEGVVARIQAGKGWRHLFT